MESRRQNFLSCWLFAGLLLLSGCGKDAPTFSTEIDFSKDSYPDSVAEIRGLSAKEAWGRWSDADIERKVTIRFKKPLPKTFALTLVAQANAQNDNPTIRIGSFEQELLVQGVEDPISIDVDLPATADTIEIIPPKPVSPKALGVNEDTRKLGVGLYSLKIEE